MLKYDEYQGVIGIKPQIFQGSAGWSQAKLAEKTGTSTQYIGIIETKIKFPSSDMLQKPALALRLDPAELFYRKLTRKQ